MSNVLSTALNLHQTAAMAVFFVLALRTLWSTAGYFGTGALAYDRPLGAATAGLVDLQGLLGIAGLLLFSSSAPATAWIHPALAVLAIGAVHVGNSRWRSRDRHWAGPALHWAAVLLLAGQVFGF